MDFRRANAEAHPGWFNGAVSSFGDDGGARLLIVGLAPGLQGANRTGRPFTGDYAGDLLYATLTEFGFARGTYGGDPSDGLELVDTLITNAVRCVPPANKPTGPEIKACQRFLMDRVRALETLEAIIALGRIAHDAVLSARGLKKSAYKFAHGAAHDLGEGLVMLDSYHCSRYNTNTGRLTPDMFRAVFRDVKMRLDRG